MQMYVRKSLVMSFTFFCWMTGWAWPDAGQLQYLYEQMGVSSDISYEATLVMTELPESKPGLTATLYYSRGNLRTEGEWQGQSFATILRTDGTLYAMNQLTEAVWIRSKIPATAEEDQLTVTLLGEETREGVLCLKYSLQDKDKNDFGFVWVQDSIICRMEMPKGRITTVAEYRDIVRKPLADALFLPPEMARVRQIDALPPDDQGA